MKRTLGWILRIIGIILMLPYIAILLYSAFALALWLGGWLAVLVAFIMLPVSFFIAPVIYLFIGQITPFVFMVGGAFIIFTLHVVAGVMIDSASQNKSSCIY